MWPSENTRGGEQFMRMIQRILVAVLSVFLLIGVSAPGCAGAEDEAEELPEPLPPEPPPELPVLPEEEPSRSQQRDT